MAVRDTIEITFKHERSRVLAAVISQFHDFELAEDTLQDALLMALEQWQAEGIPHNPGAWLTAIAKRRAIDRVRRRTVQQRRQLSLEMAEHAADTPAQAEDDVMLDDIPDERLKLMFTCCHPALSLEAQVALTLHTLGGLSTAEVARAFLVPMPTMAQRLTRAKGKIRDAGIPFQIPPSHLLPERLEALLAVLYLIFNEGYSASSGDALIRRELCQEAIRLAHVLVDLLPDEGIVALKAEALGLLALLLLHDSRREARTSDQGDLILLEDRDRGQWDHAEIGAGTAVLNHAMRLGYPGPYQVQAAISALHAEVADYADTDWAQIAELYGVLAEMTPSPVIEVNRAVAVSMAAGVRAGLALLLPLGEVLDHYLPYHAACADLLRRTHEREAATEAYQRALDLCENAAEQAYLRRRLAELAL